MQAIITKFLPATNNKAARIKASCERGSVTVTIPDHLDVNEAHAYAVGVLRSRFVFDDVMSGGDFSTPWACSMVRGGLPRSSACSYAFVFAAGAFPPSDHVPAITPANICEFLTPTASALLALKLA